MARVIFRKYKDNGDIVAIFPGIAADYNGTYCMCYEHIGQHGSCSYSYMMNITSPATEGEYMDLYKELINVGYDMQIAKRQSNKDRQSIKLQIDSF